MVTPCLKRKKDFYYRVWKKSLILHNFNTSVEKRKHNKIKYTKKIFKSYYDKLYDDFIRHRFNRQRRRRNAITSLFSTQDNGEIALITSIHLLKLK